MKNDEQFRAKSPTKVFVKLTFLGCFLLGFIYIFLLIFNSALKALQ